MNHISFITPVKYQGETTFFQKIQERADSYLYLGRMSAYVIPGQVKNTSQLVELKRDNHSRLKHVVICALKIATYITIVMPLIAFALKFATRSTHHFHVGENHFDTLPRELPLHLFNNYLDGKDLAHCSQVSKQFHEMIELKSTKRKIIYGELVESAKQIHNANPPENSYLRIAALQVRSGNKLSAQRILAEFANQYESINDFGNYSNKVRLLTRIAQAQGAYGDILGMAQTLGFIQFEKIAGSLTDCTFRDIAKIFASAGYIVTAEEMLNYIHDVRTKDYVRLSIALFKIFANEPDAEQAINQILMEINQDTALAAFAKRQYVQGDVAKAKEIFNRISNKGSKAQALVDLANTQKLKGNLSIAKELLLAAKIETNQENDPEAKIEALQAVAKGQLACGNVDDAKKTLAEAKAIATSAVFLSDYIKVRFFVDISKDQALCGDVNGSKETLSEAIVYSDQLSIDYQLLALSGIARAEIDRGDIENARKTIEKYKTGLKQYRAKHMIAIMANLDEEFKAALYIVSESVQEKSKILNQIKDAKTKAAVCLEIAKKQKATGDNEASKKTLTLAKENARKIRDAEERFDLLHDISSLELLNLT